MTERGAELAGVLAAILKAVPELREAGLRGRVRVGDVEFTIGPTDLDDGDEQEPERSLDPLDDPDTFGGGKVPRLRGDG